MDTIEIKELGNSEIEITAEIAVDEFESYRGKVIKKLSESVEISGFRKGHVPESVLVQKVGEDAILHEMAEVALADFYPKILKDKKIDALGRPQITITKIAKGNPLGFKVKTAVVPQIELPDYKVIAKKIPKRDQKKNLEVTDKELEETIIGIRKNWEQREAAKGGKQDQGGSKIVDKPVETPVQGQTLDGLDGMDEEKLPPLTDDFVGQLGKFENVEDFKQKIRQNLEEEKRAKAREKRRIEIIEEIIKKLRISVPHVLIEGECEKMMAEFKNNISLMGMDLENYFTHIKKSEDELKKEWFPEAEKRSKTQLVLSRIAEAENLTVPEEELERETDHLLKYHKGQSVDPLRARAYVENLLLNEKTFQFLEEQE